MTTSVRYVVDHETAYDYSAEVVHSHHVLHLAPREMSHQTCSAHSIDVEPPPTSNVVAVDAFGNPIARLEFDRPHRRLAVRSRMEVEVRLRPKGHASQTLPWERVRNQLMYVARPPGAEKLEAARYRTESPHVRIKQKLTDFGADCFTSGCPVLVAADELMMKLFKQMTYAPGATEISTPLLNVLEQRRGVCQDYAHLMIGCLRSRGLAARYVSGYLRTTPRAGSENLVGADASHAWVSAYCPPVGWIEFDPTNGVRAGLDHIALAWGRDFGDVSPLRGVILGGGRHKLSVRVQVRAEDPSTLKRDEVTK
jgi:transglutaminase-like putative cysteine protease